MNPSLEDMYAKLQEHQANQPCTEHYAALGHFIAQCSRVEVSLHILLKHFVAIDEPIARMLIGEPRQGDLIELIKKAIGLRGVDEPSTKIIAEFLNHAAYCNKVRSIVAHKPFRIKNPNMVFQNSMTAKSLPALFEYKTTAEQLSNISKFADNLATIIYSITVPGVDFEMFEDHAKYLTSLKTQVMPVDP